jgi:hypothetical protein
MGRKTDLEGEIEQAYALLREHEEIVQTSERPEERLRSEKRIERCRAVLRESLRAYLRVCRRLGEAPERALAELAADLLDRPAERGSRDPRLPDPPPATLLPGSRVVQVGISQLFRIADILTLPKSVRAQAYYRTITEPAAMRRTLSRKRSFAVGTLGALRPVAGIGGADDFWGPGVPDFRHPAALALCFIPFELPLEDRLASLDPLRESRLDDALADPEGRIENRQMNGRLRIYPPGVGVIHLAVTLTFKEAVEVGTLSRIAQNLESLLFVDPTGRERPCEQLFLEVIEQVVRFLFHRQEGDALEDRRWHPPHLRFSFRDGGALAEGGSEPEIQALADLMSRAPGNEEGLDEVAERLRAALRSPHWRHSRILAAAGQRVSLIAVGSERRGRLLSWLAESAELVSAATFAELALCEDLATLAAARRLDASWRPGAGESFAYLLGLCESLRQVKQASASIPQHLIRRGSGVLMAFARDVWRSGRTTAHVPLDEALAYLAEWVEEARSGGAEPELARLAVVVEELRRMRRLFAGELSPGLQEGREKDLLDRLRQLGEDLRGAPPDGAFLAALREAQRIGHSLEG